MKVKTYGKKPYEMIDPYKDLYISVAIFGITLALTIIVVISFVVGVLRYFGVV